MSEVKHTRGPWFQHPEFPWIIKQDNSPICESGVTICSTTAHQDSGYFPTPGEGRANARLIAAAPDGLDVAQAIEHALTEGFSGGAVLDENSPLRAALRAFIAKATGTPP